MIADPTDPRPIYQQISDDLKAMILSGELPEGERAPSTKELSQFHDVNPTTAAKAMTQLSSESLVEKRRGLGMFVSAGARKRIRAQRTHDFVRDFIAPLKREAAVLGLSDADVIKLLNNPDSDPAAQPASQSAAPSNTQSAPRKEAR